MLTRAGIDSHILCEQTPRTLKRGLVRQSVECTAGEIQLMGTFTSSDKCVPTSVDGRKLRFSTIHSGRQGLTENMEIPVFSDTDSTAVEDPELVPNPSR